MYPTGERKLMPSFPHCLALNMIFNILRSLFAPTSFVAQDVAILRDPLDHRDHLMPDVFVVLGAGEIDPVYGVIRRQYRLWHEANPPDIVIEASSRTTMGRDKVGKKEDYAAMGVREYVQFDPTSEFLTPRLQVFWLNDEVRYEPAPAEADGSVHSAVLDYDWVRAGDYLRLRDRHTGRLVPAPEARDTAEAARAQLAARAEVAEAARAQEAARAEAAEVARAREAARAEAAEAELARLRAELAALSGGASPAPDEPSPARDQHQP
jgi:hypothetical protein